MGFLQNTMKLRISIITLAIDDLERSVAFYRDGLGLTAESMSAGADHVAFHLENDFSLVLYPRGQIAKLAGQIEGTRSSSECVVSHNASSKDEVDEIIKRVEMAGAVVTKAPTDHPWGYTGYFTDPDGHLWEILWQPTEDSET
jgi:predicted lactoylglutathione lyase